MLVKAMNVGEILDNTFSLFKKQYKAYLTVVAYTLAISLVIALGLSMLKLLLGNQSAGGLVITGICLLSVLYIPLVGGLTKLASEQILGRESLSAKEAFRYAAARSGKLLLCMIVGFIFMAIGFVLLAIPGIYLAVSLTFALHAIILEGRGPLVALTRSRKLIKGYWWRCFGILSLANLLVYILAKIAWLPFGLLVIWGFDASSTLIDIADILDVIISCFFTPLAVIADTLLYYDLRVRKENFDLQLMIQNLTESEVNEHAN